MSSISSSDSPIDPVINPALVRRAPFTSSTPAATKAVKAPKPGTKRVAKRVAKAGKEKGPRGSNWSEDDSVLLAEACGYVKLSGPSKQ